MKIVIVLAFSYIIVTTKAKSLENFDLDYAGSDSEYEKGGGKKFEAAHHSENGEEGEKGYKGHHSVEKGAEGHHEKEGQKKHYAEEGGNKKAHHHDDGYYAEQHKGEKGQKGYSYQDGGSYAKGHSTKGHHKVHKLDEFKKNTEFYDEKHDEGHKEKHGGFEEKKGVSSGGHEKGGHFKKVYLEGEFDKSGQAEKGSHYFDDSGYKKAEGHDGHYKHGEEFAKHNGNDGDKQWAFFTHH